jgi:hypothetical protein
MLAFLAGSLLVVGVIGAAICYKFTQVPVPPSGKKKVRVPDFDVGLSLGFTRPTLIPV